MIILNTARHLTEHPFFHGFAPKTTPRFDGEVHDNIQQPLIHHFFGSATYQLLRQPLIHHFFGSATYQLPRQLLIHYFLSIISSA